MYTGDDFNYAELMAGDEEGHSHGLLGILDPIAPVAAVALAELAQGRAARFRELLDPTVALSREIFRAPTRHYKAGIVFLAWLNGHQKHFSMAGGMQSARGALHFARVFELADACGALADPELASAISALQPHQIPSQDTWGLLRGRMSAPALPSKQARRRCDQSDHRGPDGHGGALKTHERFAARVAHFPRWQPTRKVRGRRSMDKRGLPDTSL
jgi:hypothetical protein